MTTPEYQRARRLGAVMRLSTVRRADGGLIGGSAETGEVERLEIGAGGLTEHDIQALNPDAELVVEVWQKVDRYHLAPAKPAADPVDDQILATIGVDPRPAADLANALGMTDGAVRARLQALRDAGLVETAGNRGWRLA